MALTAIGVSGVVSWVVRHATKEIGIRMALGAARARLLRDMVLRGMWPVCLGLIVGGGASLAASRLFVGLVVGVTGVSTAVMTVAAVLLLVTAAIAACIPAHRAMTIDPAAALRME